MRVVEFAALSPEQIDQAVRMLGAAFANLDARAEVETFVANNGRHALASLDGADVRGWIGWLEGYSHAWELHPLVVDEPFQRRGIGTALVGELEQRARAAGILTLWLGADDESGGTNLYGVDVFPSVLRHAAFAEQTTRHPIRFYRKVGFQVVGLLPDANGFGKPDILMAKRVTAS